MNLYAVRVWRPETRATNPAGIWWSTLYIQAESAESAAVLALQDPRCPASMTASETMFQVA